MPLLDHFHPPVGGDAFWASFHGSWIDCMKATLNGPLLPAGYRAQSEFSLGTHWAVDVAAVETETQPVPARNGQPQAGTALPMRAEVWAPPAPTLVFDHEAPDVLEVRVVGGTGGPRLAAAIELVSPRNKDRREARAGFAAKCAAVLQAGAGLVVLDVVTDRLANLHNELMELLGTPPDSHFPAGTPNYAVAYRPVRAGEGAEGVVQCWLTALLIGATLPVVPLALLDGPTLPLDLEVTYSDACRRDGLGR